MDVVDHSNSDAKIKEKRKNKKKLKKIRKQMEFYFSDSNVAKDKFLLELINKNDDGFVDLEVFKSFNKIKAVTQSVEDICIALSRSEALQVSSDGKQVRRINSLPESTDFDACTIYVEKLPFHANHKWLRDVFERFGSVAHVSIPHFKTSGKIKGFAFVEFSSSDSVEKACESFKCSRQEEGEDTDCKERKMGKKKKGVKTKKRSINESLTENEHLNTPFKPDTDENVVESNQSMDTKVLQPDQLASSTKRMTKRRRQQSNENEDTPKKFKICDMEQVDSNVETETNTEVIPLQESSEEAIKLCQKRKRHSKNSTNCDSLHLRVMKKTDWKVYRNKFLSLQRATLSHLKKTIMLEAQHLQELDHDLADAEIIHETKPCLQFVPGVIIKVTLQEPIVSSTGLKSQVKVHASAAYVEAPIGHTEAHIRCYTSEDAKNIIGEGKLNHLGLLEILKDTEEKQYWNKLENDRKIKFSSATNSKKRGRDKIIAKAAKISEQKNKHMYFDD